MKTHIAIPCALLGWSALVGGCTTNRSPLEVQPSATSVGLSDGLILGGSAAAGAAGGYALSHDALGAAAGAGAGLLVGAVADNLTSAARLRREAELVETAKRQTRSALMAEYWEAERYNRAPAGAAVVISVEVSYPGGYFEGVNLGPRRTPSAAPLDEPKRQ